MSDSEDSSSGEDEDYLPSGEDYSEDDVSELVKEEEVEEDKQPSRGKCKKGSQRIACWTKKKGNVLFLEPDSGKSSKDSESEEDEPEECKNAHKDENAQRKKEDALWASFLSDVGQKPNADPDNQMLRTQKDEPAKEKSSLKPQEIMKEPEKKKVAITKVFDFAGEEVRVTQEVDPTSKEALLFLKQEEGKAVGPASPPTVSGVKRPAGLNSLLGKIGSKKQKMSTLEKSKLDWEDFKEREGIGEELATHNRGKDGYLERKAFLERVDHRQFEIERDIRLSNMKP